MARYKKGKERQGVDMIPIEIMRSRMARCLLASGFFNQVIKAKSMPHDWSKSTRTSIWKNEGDIADCLTRRPIRLMSRIPKIFERVLEARPGAIELPPSAV
ncbi:unnamed protein product [Strongylus vulgaris]|uniref:Uncharacterized protein n=1 Tax=Strongylus vulgaris TaxID=40348 RepID=A0A3P7I5Y5_STRVU|nr:unnamed protein product [Strongylus vulgaris]